MNSLFCKFYFFIFIFYLCGLNSSQASEDSLLETIWDIESGKVIKQEELIEHFLGAELIYLGDHVRTRVKVCGNNQFIVKIPNSSDHSDLKEGATVKLSWKSGDTRALDFKA